MSVLVISEILGLFVNTLTADDEFFLRNRKNLPQPTQIQLSKNQKNLSQFFASYRKPTSSFEHFKQKLTLIGYVFTKLETVEDVIS